MNNQSDKNELVSSLVVWIDKYNNDLKRWIFSKMKMKLVQ